MMSSLLFKKELEDEKVLHPATTNKSVVPGLWSFHVGEFMACYKEGAPHDPPTHVFVPFGTP